MSRRRGPTRKARRRERRAARRAGFADVAEYREEMRRLNDRGRRRRSADNHRGRS